MSNTIISAVAALIRDPDGRVLLVRKRGTEAFMQPGGKREVGENDVAALSREIAEELSCRVRDASAHALGVFDCPAANEPGFQVNATVYAVDVEGPIKPAGGSIRSFGLIRTRFPICLTRDHVLPLARSLQ